jgi:glycosyltransferase involved in cell wall biosynthesis
VKLIIQIPCFNEAELLPQTFAELPTSIEGIDCIETVVIDDGSSDDTVAVAKELGVDHVVSHTRNLGLAKAFENGLQACLRQGADIIVNTDADLVAPIVRDEADIVIGDRQIDQISHFSPFKKWLQRLGSWMVRTVSGTEVPDAPSGFRAYSKDTALRLNILSRFSYTLETIIQAGKMGLTIVSVPVETNKPTRPSRLQRNTWHFVKAQASTILRLYAFYEPLRTFSYIALPFLVLGLASWVRFLYFNSQNIGGHLQSLTVGTGLFLVGILILLNGIQADIASKHRQLTQESLYRLKKIELEKFLVEKEKCPEQGEGLS